MQAIVRGLKRIGTVRFVWRPGRLIAAAGVLAGTAAVAAPPSRTGSLAPFVGNLVERTMREHGVPGLAVGIVRGGRVIYAHGFGVSSTATARPVTARSVFHIASVTKTFTAAAAMQLVERGRLRLDAPVTDYLPYFTMRDERYRQITIGHLLRHRSGIPFVEENPFELRPVYDARAIERHVRELSRLELSFAPGTRFEYSNYGYDLLGDVVAKVSGMSFEDYVQRNILTPLRMSRSTLLVRQVPAGRMSTPYFSDEQGRIASSPIFPYTRAFTPSSNLYTDVDDMNRWMLANLQMGTLHGRRILRTDSYATLWQLPVAVRSEQQFPLGGQMGAGWFRWNYHGRQLVGHGGADLGFNTYILLAPEAGIGIVVMGNLYPARVNYSPTGTYYTADVAKLILDRLLETPGAPAH